MITVNTRRRPPQMKFLVLLCLFIWTRSKQVLAFVRRTGSYFCFPPFVVVVKNSLGNTYFWRSLTSPNFPLYWQGNATLVYLLSDLWPTLVILSYSDPSTVFFIMLNPQFISPNIFQFTSSRNKWFCFLLFC